MKRTASIFAAAYALFLSLGWTCLLNLAGIIFASAIDGGVIDEYPRFVSFCYAIGSFALISIVVCFVLNIKSASKSGFTRKSWAIEFICAFAASFPMAALWEMLFGFLQKIL